MTTNNDIDTYIRIAETIESLAEAHTAYSGICSDEDVITAALDARVDTIMKSLAEAIALWRAGGVKESG